MRHRPWLLLVLAAACAPRPELSEVALRQDGGASIPTVASSADGVWRYAAWVESTPGRANVWLVRAHGDGEWSTPVRVNHLAGDAAPHEQAPAQVEVAPDGTVYVLWQNNTDVPGRPFPASNLRLAVSRDHGRTFEPARYVNDDAGGPPASHTFHDLAIAADGSVYVSWIDGRGRAADDSAPPRAHHAHGGSDVRVARSTDGGRSFGRGTVVARGVCPCCRTSLALAGPDTVYVAFRAIGAHGARDVVVARSADGARQFAAPVRVHADDWRIDGCPHAGPAVAVDRGVVHVAWYTGAGSRPGAYHARSEDAGASFSAPEPLLAAAWVPPTQVQLAAGRGGVWVAWDDRRGAVPEVRLARLGQGRVRPLAQSWEGKSPALSVAGRGALLGWLDAERVRVVEAR